MRPEPCVSSQRGRSIPHPLGGHLDLGPPPSSTGEGKSLMFKPMCDVRHNACVDSATSEEPENPCGVTSGHLCQRRRENQSVQGVYALSTMQE